MGVGRYIDSGAYRARVRVRYRRLLVRWGLPAEVARRIPDLRTLRATALALATTRKGRNA